MAEERIRTEIERAFPELPVRGIAFLGWGIDSDAYLVNDAWVFRFPNRLEVARALSREIAMLPKLAGRLPIAIPRFDFIGRQTGNRLLFAGYRLIRGEPLTVECFDSLTLADQERVLATLAAFLQAVHRFQITEAAAIGLEEISTREWVEECLVSGKARVLPLLAPRDREALVNLFADFLADTRNFANTPHLLYADFAPQHILYDADARDIAGIIDWGDLEIGDPDFDLLYLRQDYGEEFVRRLLGHFPHPEPARLFEKLRVFDACDHVDMIVDALGNPVEHDAVDESVTALGELLKRE